MEKSTRKQFGTKNPWIGKNIEGEIVFSIANIFVEKYTGDEEEEEEEEALAEPKSIICVAKEILVREIIEEKRSYFNIPVGEDSDDEGGRLVY